MSEFSDTLHARVDPRTKKEAAKVLSKVGVDMSSAIRLYLQAIINAGGIPFDVRIPNAETQKAMDDARKKRNLRKFSSKKDFFDSLKG